MTGKKGNPAEPGPSEVQSSSTAEGDIPGEKRKKVYDRVLLWMLDIKPLNKDMKTSPLIEVSEPTFMGFPTFGDFFRN